MNPVNESHPLLRFCHEFRRRLARLLIVAGGARWICLAIALFAVLAIIDWWMHWSGWVRGVTLIGFVAVLGTVARKLWQAIRGSRWTDRQVLNFLGQTSPETSRDWLVAFELESARDEIQELESATGRDLADTLGETFDEER